MRLSDLLGANVIGADGDLLGLVSDVRLTQVGPVPPDPAVKATFVVESLLVSTRHTGSLFGYERRPSQGPALLRMIVRALHRRATIVNWAAVTDWDAENRQVMLTWEREHRRSRSRGHGRR